MQNLFHEILKCILFYLLIKFNKALFINFKTIKITLKQKFKKKAQERIVNRNFKTTNLIDSHILFSKQIYFETN